MQRIYTKNFLKEAKSLRKKYRTLDSDIRIFANLIKDDSLISCAKISNFGDLEIYKTRLKNSSLKSGKSSGFRVIYYLRSKDCCYFLSIYSKSQKNNISKNEILKILKDENLIL